MIFNETLCVFQSNYYKNGPQRNGSFPQASHGWRKKKAPARVGICLPEGVLTQFYRMKLKTRHEND